MAEQDHNTIDSINISKKDYEELIQNWSNLSTEDQHQEFLKLDRQSAENLFLQLPSSEQADLFKYIPPIEKKIWIRLLPPDDIVDLAQCMENKERYELLSLLEQQTRNEVIALLAYSEDEAGGLMNSRFARLRPDMTVEEAIRYLRVQTRQQVETIYYGYVLDQTQKLLGVVSLRQLFYSPSEKKVSEIMTKKEDLVVIHENQDQEEIAHTFSKKEHTALPVVDHEGKMKGIVTVDDVVQVVRDEATEDIQKFGGMEALDEPYLKNNFFTMIKKRAGWLLILFIGEMFTATAMGYYDEEISRAVVLALFIPLIISSGGNSGSQASTLVIRSLALGEIRLRDWWRVLIREIASGLLLGIILGLVGLARIFFWPARQSLYGEHFGLISLTVGCSLVGIVLWGTLIGSMLPFIFRTLKFDPATASAPFVATLVDVTGLIIYFSVAHIFLQGVLL